MAGLKSIMTRPVFSRRSRREADATSSSSSSSTIGGEEGGGTGWEPVVWQAAVVGVVGAAALCLTVWYMARGGSDEREGEEEERRKLMTELEARELKMARDVALLEKLGASAIRAARREADQTNQNEQAGAVVAHQHDRTDPHHHLDQQAVRVQQLEMPNSRLLAKRAREDCQRRRDEIRHMHQILDQISGQGSESASRREQVRIVEDLLGRIEATNDGLTQEMGRGDGDGSADNDDDGDGDDSEDNKK